MVTIKKARKVNKSNQSMIESGEAPTPYRDDMLQSLVVVVELGLQVIVLTTDLLIV